MSGTFTNTGTVFLQSVGIQYSDPELDGGGHLTLFAATFDNVDNFISGSGQLYDASLTLRDDSQGQSKSR